MTGTPTDRARVQAQATNAVQAAVIAELESFALERMERAGGNLAQLSRFRSFIGEALGILGTVNDILDMAIAGWEAMTIERRMVMRVSAAHGFAYWAFQHTNIPNPRNPPNGFLVMHRARDRRDRHIGEVTDNPDFSSDGGLSSAHWNVIWQRGVRNSSHGMQSQLLNLALRGQLQRSLQDTLGRAAALHQQSHEATVNQYRVLKICPALGSPAAAATGYLLAMLGDADNMERRETLRLYRRFPYRPGGTR